MLTKDDLGTLISAAPSPAVSIFLPTHKAGREIRQDPIRLRNLLDDAERRLAETGMRETDARKMLSPARDLTEDYAFWRHQNCGLALFLAPDFFQYHKVPIDLPELAVVGTGFHVKPLLSVLTADGRFFLLAATSAQVRLFEGSRFGMVERDDAALPKSIAPLRGETDYDETAHANPAGRPRTGLPTQVPGAHNFGETAEELRKTQLVEFVRRLSAAVADELGDDQAPLVLAAEPEIEGHFRKIYGRNHLLPESIDVNPDAVDESELHRRAYALVQPQFVKAREDAVARFESLAGNGDDRATTAVAEIVKAARFGRLDTLFVGAGERLWGRFDEDADGVDIHDDPERGDIDLLDYASAQTLLQGGAVHLMDKKDLPRGDRAAAILRWGDANP